MNNYSEDKKKLDSIRNNWEYCTQGDMLFRTAMLMVFEAGFDQMKEKEFLESCLKYNADRHEKAETEGKILFTTKAFDDAIYQCAHEIAQISIMSVVMYSQREIFFYDGQDPSYQDMKRTVEKCLEVLDEYNHCEDSDLLWDCRNRLDLSDEEIEFYGFNYLLKDDEDEWEE